MARALDRGPDRGLRALRRAAADAVAGSCRGLAIDGGVSALSCEARDPGDKLSLDAKRFLSGDADFEHDACGGRRTAEGSAGQHRALGRVRFPIRRTSQYRCLVARWLRPGQALRRFVHARRSNAVRREHHLEQAVLGCRHDSVAAHGHGSGAAHDHRRHLEYPKVAPLGIFP